MKPSNRKKSKRTDRPTLPELDQTKKSVLNSLASLQSRRSYQYAMEEFIDWYCSEPRLALNRGVVLRYRMQLETQQLAPATINVRLAAVRRLVYEAADTGLLSSELVAGIRRVKGIPQLGRRVGNWLTASEGDKLLSCFDPLSLRGKRDAAIISLLLGCGLRRSEVVGLKVDAIQRRQDHWRLWTSWARAAAYERFPSQPGSRPRLTDGQRAYPLSAESSSDRYARTARFGATESHKTLLVRREGLRGSSGNKGACPSRLEEDVRPPVPRRRRRVGTNPISSGTRVRSDNRTLHRM